MRQPPISTDFDGQDEPRRAAPRRVRRVSTAPIDQAGRRSEVRYIRGGQRIVPKRGPDPRVWFVRGALGVAALAVLWLGLQALFPLRESRVSEVPPPPTLAVDASTVGAPEPPAGSLPPPVAAQPPPSAVGEPAAPLVEGDRLPGLPTPAAIAISAQASATNGQAAPANADASSNRPAAAEAQAAASQPPSQTAPQPEPTAQPEPTEQPPAEAEAQPPAESEEPAAQPAAQEPPPGPAAKPTAAPIPPPENPARAPVVAAAPPPAPVRQQPAPPPAAAASSGGPFELAASASPANPLSEQAQVTISVRATQNGAPVAGASCMATVHYRTATARQPNGGFTTNASGVGSFVLDARGTTFGFFIPVDVTCTGRSGTATARTGFTPVKGR